jgi:hypothetical protein
MLAGIGHSPIKKVAKVYNISLVEVSITDFKFFAIPLGEKGRGRILVNVACPATFTHLEVGTTKQGKPRLNPSTHPKGWVARISTEGAYVRGAFGNVTTSPEVGDKIQVVARGQGAFGDAGRTGTWDDILVSTELEEFILRVKPSRGDAYLLLFREGKVTRFTYEEADLLEVDLYGSTSTSRGEMVRL